VLFLMGAGPLVGSASTSICGSGSGKESCYLLAAGGTGGQPVPFGSGSNGNGTAAAAALAVGAGPWWAAPVPASVAVAVAGSCATRLRQGEQGGSQ
jgi:hypothetical protein